MRKKKPIESQKLGIFLRGKSSITVKLNSSLSGISHLTTIQDTDDVDKLNFDFENKDKINNLQDLRILKLSHHKQGGFKMMKNEYVKKSSDKFTESQSYQIDTNKLSQVIKEVQEESSKTLNSSESGKFYEKYKDSILGSPIEEELKYLLEENELSEFE